MTVREAIEKLSEMPPDAKLVMDDCDGYYIPVDEMEVNNLVFRDGLNPARMVQCVVLVPE